MILVVDVTFEFILSNLAVFIAGIALGVALESWRRGRNNV
jgi:hypothetical protein